MESSNSIDDEFHESLDEYTSENEDCKYLPINNGNVDQDKETAVNPIQETMSDYPDSVLEAQHMELVKNHFLLDYGNESNEVLRCVECDYKTKVQENLRLHEQRHKTGGSANDNCLSNDQDFVDNSWVDEKLPDHYKILQCPDCRYKTDRIRFFNLHRLKKHIDPRIYQCNTCDYKTVRKSNFFYHTRKHQEAELLVDSSNSHETFKCKDCEFEAPTRSLMYRHNRKHKPGYVEPPRVRRSKDDVVDKRLFICQTCDFRTTKKSTYYYHTRKHKEALGLDKLEPPKIYKCKYCALEVPNRSILYNHTQEHVKQVKAEEQSGDGETAEELPIHYCSQCDYSAEKLAHLRLHMLRKHKTPRLYQCNTCDWATTKKSSYYYHIRKHQEDLLYATDPAPEEIYKCTQCDFAAATKSILYRHNQDHAKRKRREELAAKGLYPKKEEKKHVVHACQECEYKTIRPGHLRLHMLRRHSGRREPKLFACEFCDYNTMQKSTFYYHMKRKHEEHYGKGRRANLEPAATNDDPSPVLAEIPLVVIKEEPVELPMYDCAECEPNTETESQHELHVRSKHSGPHIFTCDTCEFVTTKRSKFNYHIRRHKEKPESMPNTALLDTYKCKKCDYEAPTKDQLNRHSRRHFTRIKPDTEPTDVDDDLGEPSTGRRRRSRKYFRPMVVEKDLKMLQCPDCDYCTDKAGHFRLHTIRKHSGPKQQEKEPSVFEEYT